MTYTAADWATIAPGVLLVVVAIVVVALDTLASRARLRPLLSLLATAGPVGALALLWDQMGSPRVSGFGGLILLDNTATVLGVGICAATAIIAMVSDVDMRRRQLPVGETYGVLLFANAALLFLVQSNDFLMLFLNLEIVSVAMYVLTGITRRNPRSTEAAAKYLLTGGFATAFLSFGIALLYGATGTLNFTEMATKVGGADTALLSVGVTLMLIGFAFKVGAVPFHAWVADVYEGASTTVTAYMSVTVKAAAFGSLARVLVTALSTRAELWSDLLWGLAAVTMVVGNVMAVRQQSVKRMLAYSSVAHTGYALAGLAAMRSASGTFSPEGAEAAIFYVFGYTFMTLGAFLFLVFMGHEAKAEGREPEWQDGERLEDLAGLAFRRPWAAIAMGLFLISLGGLPPTVGFLGKLLVFKAVVGQGHVILAIIGVLSSLVSWYYYLQVVVAMFMKPTVYEDERPDLRFGLAIFLSAALTLLLGVQPWVLLGFASNAMSQIR